VPGGRGPEHSGDVVFPVLHARYARGTCRGFSRWRAFLRRRRRRRLGRRDGARHSIEGRLSATPAARCRWLWPSGCQPADEIRRRVDLRLGFPCFVHHAQPGLVGRITGKDRRRSARFASPAGPTTPRVIEEAATAREFEGCSGQSSPEPRCRRAWSSARVLLRHPILRRHNARAIIPAHVVGRGRRRYPPLAVQAFRAVDCAGRVRASFFLDERAGRCYVNDDQHDARFTPEHVSRNVGRRARGFPSWSTAGSCYVARASTGAADAGACSFLPPTSTSRSATIVRVVAADAYPARASVATWRLS